MSLNLTLCDFKKEYFRPRFIEFNCILKFKLGKKIFKEIMQNLASSSKLTRPTK